MNYVSGASGFIGSQLVKRLQDAVLIPHEQLSTITLQPFDNFYFLSAYGNMAGHNDNGVEETAKVVKANLLDLAHCIDQAARLGFRSFVYISTSSVKLPVQTTYSRTKKAAEELLLAYIEKYNLPICIIRPFSVTGVGEQQAHLIPTLIRSCLDGEAIKFVPEPVHDFLDVDDMVEGILNLSQHEARGIFELGTGIQTSNQEVLDIVERVTERKANKTVVNSLRQYDTTTWVSKNFKGRGWGWLPKKSLQQSVTEMVKAYESKRPI